MGYAGMDPTRSESGETVRSDGHMSKRGPGALRWAFMQAADCARKNDPYFGDYYDRKRGVDGKHHYVALSGVARKLMGVALAVMKEGRPYEPAPPRPPEGGVKAHVDRKNRTSPMPGTLHGAGCWRALSYLAFTFQGSYQKVSDSPLTPNSRSSSYLAT